MQSPTKRLYIYQLFAMRYRIWRSITPKLLTCPSFPSSINKLIRGLVVYGETQMFLIVPGCVHLFSHKPLSSDTVITSVV